MSLRRRFLVYLAAVHLLMAAAAVALLVEHREWLFGVEALLVASIFVAWRLVRAFFVPLELIRTGTELIEERDFATRFRPVGQEELDRLIEVYNRMVDQLRAERLRLREQVELFDRVVEASPGGFVICDLDGRVDRLNPSAERLLGHRAVELEGRRPAELPPPLGGALATLGAGESRVLVLADGRRLRLGRAGFRDRGFERSFFLVEELTEEIRRSEKAAYEKLIRMMSHEVNNTVTAVRSLLGSAAELAQGLEAAEGEEAHRALAVASERMGRLAAFVARFAEVVRLPAPERRPTDMRRLLEDLAVLLRGDLEARGIRLRLELPDDVESVVSLDKNQLEQVLLNVLKNAAEAIGEEGEIVVRLEAADGRRRLVIEDTGGGLPAEARGELFVPFFTTKEDGCGLGLTVIKEVLDRHGFPFVLENGERGARFEVRL